MEDVGQRVQTSVLMRVYHRVAGQGHVEELGRVTDDLEEDEECSLFDPKTST